MARINSAVKGFFGALLINTAWVEFMLYRATDPTGRIMMRPSKGRGKQRILKMRYVLVWSLYHLARENKQTNRTMCCSVHYKIKD